MLAHDVQMASAGVTTVFDSITVGDSQRKGFRSQVLGDLVNAIFGDADMPFRSEHLLHLRCEVSDGDMIELLAEHLGQPCLRLISMMDHTPGQRQWVNVAKYRERQRVKLGLDEAGLDLLIAERLEDQRLYAERNHAYVVERARKLGIPLATHDDTTPEDVAVARDAGAAISEFPTTIEAAHAARQGGMAIVMGAPNVILGGSHSGNVSASALARQGLLDILSSDYVPTSLIEAPWKLHAEDGLPLHETIAMVTANPARAAGLADRGALAEGLRADLVRVGLHQGTPVVRAVWRGGVRVA